MSLKLRSDLLQEGVENISFQANLFTDATIWTVPPPPRMVNLKMNFKGKVMEKKEEMTQIKFEADKPERLMKIRSDATASKVSCKICEKEILLYNLGKHTYKVHCLSKDEYDEIYGKVQESLPRKRKMDNLAAECGEAKRRKEAVKVKKEITAFDYKSLSTKELLAELERVLAA